MRIARHAFDGVSLGDRLVQVRWDKDEHEDCQAGPYVSL
jgi:hypothetical protein